MLTGENIVCISIPPWKGKYASATVELMKILGQSNKVLYVQNPYTIKDVLVAFVKRDKSLPYLRIFGFQSRTQQDSATGVYVMVPPLCLTINFLPKGFLYDRLLRVNGWIVRQSIRKWIRKLRMNKNLINIVSFNPLFGSINAGRLGEKLVIYHCYDEIRAAKWMKNHGENYEIKMMEKADAVIVTSQELYDRKYPFSKQCFIVKNGVNLSVFTTAFREEPPRRKTVGFIGNFNERIDFALLHNLIESLPELDFLLIGPFSDNKVKAQLSHFPNVNLPGAKTQEELPAYVSLFSIGIIPFIKNDFTKAIYPVKINEYLAAGLPVVATNFGDLSDFEELINIAESNEAFRSLLLNEINTDSRDKRIKRAAVAGANSWQKRAEEISVVINTLY